MDRGADEVRGMNALAINGDAKKLKFRAAAHAIEQPRGK
jgi:hypothetical protein